MFNEFETKLTPESNWELKYIHIFKGIFIATSENEYKKGNKIQLDENTAEFTIQSKSSDDLTFFTLTIKTNQHEVIIRSNSRISLEYIIFHATQKEDRDIGRPLTFCPHLSNIESPLEQKRINENNYRGFFNLIVIALVLSHLRLMYENYTKYGILIIPRKVFDFLIQDDNFVYLLTCIGITSTSIIVAFMLEKLASSFQSRNRTSLVLQFLHGVNLIGLLLVPLKCHDYGLVNPCML